ncbi:hypothetical protein [Acidipropionibacterium acidipropionici]|uniref:hypothetical protein n=1 Tax=Acidipropionibacterium acidipropionici TaxID=1748 RepID=UPI00110AC1AD|nr:hypothetical protein [Acidipropionibacterium acidipropionici]QCV95648.1 hypothetical protein FEZ30_10635 [Acidipropionibacterium acidipropionici]
MSTPTTEARLDDLIAAYADLLAQKEALDSALDSIKLTMAELGEGKHEGRRGRVAVTHTRRFDTHKAQELLEPTPELLASVTESVISSSKAKRLLPPALYEACQTTSEKATVRVTIA